jgi:hypothetical protein
MQAFAILYDHGTNTLILNDPSLGSCFHIHPHHQQRIIEAACLDFDISFAMSQFLMGSAPPGSALPGSALPGSAPHVSPAVTDEHAEAEAEHAEAYGAEHAEAEHAEAEQADVQDFIESHSATDELAHQLAALAIVATKSPPARDTATDRLCGHVGGSPHSNSEPPEELHSSTESTETAGFAPEAPASRAPLAPAKSTPLARQSTSASTFVGGSPPPFAAATVPSEQPVLAEHSPMQTELPDPMHTTGLFFRSRALLPHAKKYARWRARVPRVLCGGGALRPPTPLRGCVGGGSLPPHCATRQVTSSSSRCSRSATSRSSERK